MQTGKQTYMHAILLSMESAGIYSCGNTIGVSCITSFDIDVCLTACLSSTLRVCSLHISTGTECIFGGERYRGALSKSLYLPSAAHRVKGYDKTVKCTLLTRNSRIIHDKPYSLKVRSLAAWGVYATVFGHERDLSKHEKSGGHVCM